MYVEIMRSMFVLPCVDDRNCLSNPKSQLQPCNMTLVQANRSQRILMDVRDEKHDEINERKEMLELARYYMSKHYMPT